MSSTHTVEIQPDGTFQPDFLRIRAGDTVLWKLHDRIDAIVPAEIGPDGQLVPAPYDPDDTWFNCTGPVVRASGGVYCMSGDEAPYDVSQAIWDAPGLTGVYLRWKWNDLEPTPGQFDWTDLDALMDKAVTTGKLISLSVKAGFKGCPSWLFNSPYNLPELRFMPTSGKPLASPCEALYVERYVQMITALGAHLRSRADWYQRLAYVKVAGANMWSSEGMLPWKMSGHTTEWLEQWATVGKYTPNGLYDFFRQQGDAVIAAFPDKTMSYQLIQDGYPIIGNDGDWLGSGGGGAGLPDNCEQTEHIIDGGAERYGTAWAVQHNGLQPPPDYCPPKEEIDPSFHYVGSGCPNRWAMAAYLDHGCPIGFQTAHVTPLGVGPSLQNECANSYGMFFETYEDYLVPVLNEDPLPGSDKSLVEWNRTLWGRRRDLFPELGDPTSGEHSYTFTLVAGDNRERVHVMNPAKGTSMVIVVRRR